LISTGIRDIEDKSMQKNHKRLFEKGFFPSKNFSYSSENPRQIVSGILNMLKIKRCFSSITLSPLKNERR